MNKRLSILISAALTAVAVVVVLAATGSAQQAGEQTIKLVERPGPGHFIDNPPKGTQARPIISAGDMSVQRIPLFDESNTTRLGTLHVECIATRGGTLARATARFHCTGTLLLQNGSLAFDGVVNSAETMTIAITGGTGAFEGRKGSVLSKARPNTNLTDDTIHLVP